MRRIYILLAQIIGMLVSLIILAFHVYSVVLYQSPEVQELESAEQIYKQNLDRRFWAYAQSKHLGLVIKLKSLNQLSSLNHGRLLTLKSNMPDNGARLKLQQSLAGEQDTLLRMRSELMKSLEAAFVKAEVDQLSAGLDPMSPVKRLHALAMTDVKRSRVMYEYLAAKEMP